MDNFDLDNLLKAVIDRLQDVYGFNDVIIEQHDNKIVERCDKWNEGSFKYYIENIK